MQGEAIPVVELTVHIGVDLLNLLEVGQGLVFLVGDVEAFSHPEVVVGRPRVLLYQFSDIRKCLLELFIAEVIFGSLERTFLLLPSSGLG